MRYFPQPSIWTRHGKVMRRRHRPFAWNREPHMEVPRYERHSDVYSKRHGHGSAIARGTKPMHRVVLGSVRLQCMAPKYASRSWKDRPRCGRSWGARGSGHRRPVQGRPAAPRKRRAATRKERVKRLVVGLTPHALQDRWCRPLPSDGHQHRCRFRRSGKGRRVVVPSPARELAWCPPRHRSRAETGWGLHSFGGHGITS